MAGVGSNRLSFHRFADGVQNLSVLLQPENLFFPRDGSVRNQKLIELEAVLEVGRVGTGDLTIEILEVDVVEGLV